MSKQFRVYLLPSDTARLLAALRKRVAFRLIADRAPDMMPVDLGIPGEGLPRRCYLVQDALAEVRLCHYPNLDSWLVQIESEVIEFSGCTFDGKVLGQGRFYFQTDFLTADQTQIEQKRPEFLAWADALFRVAKRNLRRDAALDAYVGQDADSFWQTGGSLR